MSDSDTQTVAMHAAPLVLHREKVDPAWIDYNGHMNLAYYVLAFDHATDAFFDYVGLGEAYLKGNNCSTFTLEAHVTYDRELMAGDPMRFETQLLDYDAKRLHVFHWMYHEEQSYLAATNELLFVNVDTATGRSRAIPRDRLDFLESVLEAHTSLGVPEERGRVMGIRRADS